MVTKTSYSTLLSSDLITFLETGSWSSGSKVESGWRVEYSSQFCLGERLGTIGMEILPWRLITRDVTPQFKKEEF